MAGGGRRELMGRPAARLLVLLAGCGRLAFDPFGGAAGDGGPGDGGGDADGAPACTTYSEWSTPVEIAGLTTPDNDWDPALHPSGTTLVFLRGFDRLWIATGNGSSFSTAALVSWSQPGDSGPTWAADGTTLYFSRREGAVRRLWASAFVGGVLQDPAQVADTASFDIAPAAITRDGLELFHGDSTSGSRIHKLARPDRASPWQFAGDEDGTNIVNAATGFPGLTPDGLTLYYEALDASSTRMYRATRAKLGERFGSPQIVQELAGVDAGDPEVAADGLSLYLAMELMPEPNKFDLGVSTRTCLD